MISYSGIGSKKAQTSFMSEARHLALNTPKASQGDPLYCPWPQSLKETMKSGELQGSPPVQFWAYLCDAEMVSAEGMRAPDDLGARQSTLIFEKVEAVCNEGENPNASLVTLRDLCKTGSTAQGFASCARLEVLRDLSMVVFAPAYPNDMEPKDRAVALQRILDKCSSGKGQPSAQGLAGALDNPHGAQILQAAQTKLGQLKESMSRCDTLKDLWHGLMHDDSCNIKRCEAAVRSAPSSDAARENVLLKDLVDIRDGLLKTFCLLLWPRPTEDYNEDEKVPDPHAMLNNIKKWVPQLVRAHRRHIFYVCCLFDV